MCKQCVYRSVAIEMVKCTCQHGPTWKTVSAVRAGQRSHFTLVREMIDTDGFATVTSESSGATRVRERARVCVG